MIDKLLDMNLLMESFPIPLPGAVKKSIAKAIPYLLKRHQVKLAKSDVVAVVVDGAGVNSFLGAHPEAEVYQLQMQKDDGAPVFVLALIGKKPE